MKEKSIYFHPGIYKFEWPYLTSDLVPDNKGEVKVYVCDVELRVGQQDDMDEGKLVTAVVTARPNTPGIQSFIDHIATKIRISFFEDIFIEKHWEKPIVPDHRIRWIERHLVSQTSPTMKDEINEVTMVWDAKRHIYTSPSWKQVDYK